MSSLSTPIPPPAATEPFVDPDIAAAFVRHNRHRIGTSDCYHSFFVLPCRGHGRLSSSPAPAPWRRGGLLLPLRSPPSFLVSSQGTDQAPFGGNSRQPDLEAGSRGKARTSQLLKAIPERTFPPSNLQHEHYEPGLIVAETQFHVRHDPTPAGGGYHDTAQFRSTSRIPC
jgi:hypothetical protein